MARDHKIKEEAARPLDQLQRGDRATVVELTSAQHQIELNRLLSMGLVPGSRIELVQRFPTFVVQVGETQLAFDESIAAGIFVRSL